MTPAGVAGIGFAVAVVGGAASYWVGGVVQEVRHERAVLRSHSRARRAHLAAIEAAEEDPSFAPEEIERAVAQIVTLAETVWRSDATGATGALEGSPDAPLVRAWARSRESWLGGGLSARRRPLIEVLRVINRDDDAEKRVVVRVRLRLHCKYPNVKMIVNHFVHLDERWTLGRAENRWVVLSVDGDPLAGPVLTAPLIPTPASDTERLNEESLAELAQTDRVRGDVRFADLVSAGESPALALPDLAVVDARFAPELIAAELAHLVEAWEEATTGSEKPFAELADAKAIAALLRPAPRTSLMIRDAVLKTWTPTHLELSRRPPAVEVRLEVEAVRYVVGTHRAGNRTEPRRMTLTWLLELTEAEQAPWRLTSTNSPAESIPGW